MIIEDFVMLGTTVPEPNSDGRVFVCSAGVSAELRKLIRIYPLARRNAPRRWMMHRVQLERNHRDSREESFQVAGDRRPGAHTWINYKFDQVGTSPVKESARPHLLSRHVVGSIQEADKRRLSLAIIQPDHMELDFQENPRSSEDPQLILFDTGANAMATAAKRFEWMPRIRFVDDCGEHNLMLRDWGTFELQRKHGGAYFKEHLHKALNFSSSSSLLVGNMQNRRKTWLVISVLNGLREPENLFDSLKPDPVQIPTTIRRKVYERDRWECVRCGTSYDVCVQPKESTDQTGRLKVQAQIDDLHTMCYDCATPT